MSEGGFLQEEGDERRICCTMTGGAIGLRTGSYGSLQQQPQNGISYIQTTSGLVRKPSKMLLSSSREKEKLRPFICRCFGRRKVAMLLLVVLALLVFIFGSFTVNKGLFFYVILIFFFEDIYFGSEMVTCEALIIA